MEAAQTPAINVERLLENDIECERRVNLFTNSVISLLILARRSDMSTVIEQGFADAPWGL